MAVIRIIGPNGAPALLEVPSPGMDQRTFDARVASGEFTVVVDEPDGHACDDCDFIAKTPAGLGAHQRKHEDS